MHIFLQGPPGTGKSSLLREAISPYISSAGGFFVQRLIEKGRNVGFQAILLKNQLSPLEVPYHPEMEHVFILDGKWDIAVLEKIILCVEEQMKTQGAKLILLDEVGGIELRSQVFMSALERILSSGTPCFGVLKSRENLGRTVANLNIRHEYTALHTQLETRIRADGEIINFSEQNRAQTLRYVKDAAANRISQIEEKRR